MHHSFKAITTVIALFMGGGSSGWGSDLLERSEEDPKVKTAKAFLTIVFEDFGGKAIKGKLDSWSFRVNVEDLGKLEEFFDNLPDDDSVFPYGTGLKVGITASSFKGQDPLRKGFIEEEMRKWLHKGLLVAKEQCNEGDTRTKLSDFNIDVSKLPKRRRGHREGWHLWDKYPYYYPAQH